MPRYKVGLSDGRNFMLETNQPVESQEQLQGLVNQQIGQEATQTQQKPRFLQDEFLKTPNVAQESPLTLGDRLKLSFADDRGREAWLRERYQSVERLPNGKFAVGNKPGVVVPIDPAGVFNDVLGDLADIVAEIPVITGQILGTIGGVAVGAVAGGIGAAPGGVIGAGAGSAAGEAVKTFIGKGLGIDERTAGELATDIAISTAFGAAGEGIAVGTRFAGKAAKRALAPKLANLIAKGADKAAAKGTLPRYASLMSKTFRFLANVPEESTNTFFRYGMKEMSNPTHFADNAILNLADDFARQTGVLQKTLGKQVGKNVDNLINVARRSKTTNTIDVSDLFAAVKKQAQAIGVLDDFGRLRTSKVIPNTEDIRPIRVLMNAIGEVRDGRFVQANKSLSVKKAVQLSRSFGDKFGKLSDNTKGIIYTMLNGSDEAGLAGLRQRITQKATELGIDDYARANAKYSRLLKLLDDLKLDPSDAGKTEAFIKNLERLGGAGKRDLLELDRVTGQQFLKRWELANAASDFLKTDFNLLRFGAVAGIIGSVVGLQTGDFGKSSVAGIAGAAIFGTPAGLRQVINLSRRMGYQLPKQALQGAGKASAIAIDQRAAGALLTQLLKQRRRESIQPVR